MEHTGNLVNAVMNMGGILFDSILRVKPHGEYLQRSHLQSLVGLLNRESYKIEVLEEDVETNFTIIQILSGVSIALVLINFILIYVTIKNNRGPQAPKMSTSIGGSNRTNIYTSEETGLAGKTMVHAVNRPSPPNHGNFSGASNSGPNRLPNLNFGMEDE